MQRAVLIVTRIIIYYNIIILYLNGMQRNLVIKPSVHMIYPGFSSTSSISAVTELHRPNMNPAWTPVMEDESDNAVLVSTAITAVRLSCQQVAH